MPDLIRGPAPRPCESCPYRQDVPSGIWDASEYAKLPAYDEETMFQPTGVFRCHQLDGRVCAGWAGCHDGVHLLALRIAVSAGYMTPEDVDATIDYQSPVPLWGSGTEAAAHGLAELYQPGVDAVAVIEKIVRQRNGRRDARKG